MKMWPFKQKKKLPNEQKWHALTLLPPSFVQVNGLPEYAVCGSIEINDQSELINNTFSPNPLFVEFLHDFIRCEASQDSELQEFAKRKLDGRICIIDNRAPEDAAGYPPEDVVGTFVVADGKMKSYHANCNYAIWTSRGLISLPGSLHEKFVKALMEGRCWPK